MTNPPSLVMIIRHGEKPGNPDNDTDGGPHLAPLGSGRAAALPSLFTPDPNATPVSKLQQLSCNLEVDSETLFTGNYLNSGISAGQPRFPTPSLLFATKQDPPNTGSNRPVETITPLAQALQFYVSPSITINTNFTNDPTDLTALVAEINNNPNTYAGKVILICWHHGMIPQLATDFGVPAAQLPWTKWPSTIFDLIFMITWTGTQANLALGYQQLLYGDTTTPS